ncbi:MAG: class I SAM-dependent methyltransferase [Pseudomonadota bacterium]
MRQAAATLESFYLTPLGRAAAMRLRLRLSALWGTCEGQSVLGVGYADPLLPLWTQSAQACISLQPDTAGAIGFGSERGNASALSLEDRFPFPEGSFDRILLLHALEEAENPRAVLREAWRVLAPEGRIVIATANRRSLWSLAENKAFGQGRPWTRRQLIRFANDSLFQVTASATAVHMPPVNLSFITAAAGTWEQVGEAIFPALGGVVLVEAVKRLYAEPGGSAGAPVTQAVRTGVRSSAVPRKQAARQQSKIDQETGFNAKRNQDTSK